MTAYAQTYANAIFPLAASEDLDTPLEFEDSDVGLAWLAGYISDNDVVIEDEETESVLKPPSTRRPVGRRQKRRIRTQNDELPRRPFRCSCCQGIGHNLRSCRSAI